MISVNTLRHRKRGFRVHDWILDSGAFTAITTHGQYRTEPEGIRGVDSQVGWDQQRTGSSLARLHDRAAILEKIGLPVEQRQALTIDHYDRIRAAVPPHIHIMPMLQGYQPAEYVAHVRAYGDHLTPGMWVGVGSICRHNGKPDAIDAVLRPIKTERPDLRLHGAGLKLTVLANVFGRGNLERSISMGRSFGAWKTGRDPNSWEEAMAYCTRAEDQLAA